MAILKEIRKRIRSIGQKLTADNVHNFGQKTMDTGYPEHGASKKQWILGILSMVVH